MATQIPSSPPLPSLHDPPSPTSSEPPIFSSDDPLDAEEAINYMSPRFKRKRAGPWWEAEPGEAPQVLPKRSKLSRNFVRNFDSGVWMQSDDSEEMEAMGSVPPQLEENLVKLETVESIIMDGISRGLEIYGTTKTFSFNDKDLRDEDLTHLSMLNRMVIVPDGDDAPPDEGSYRPS